MQFGIWLDVNRIPHLLPYGDVPDFEPKSLVCLMSAATWERAIKSFCRFIDDMNKVPD